MDSSRPNHDGERGYITGINGDGSKTYYISEADETADGPGGELVTYPPGHASSMLFPHTYHSPRQRDPSFPETDQANGRLSTYDTPSSGEDSRLDPGAFADDSRYSRDYQFTIASPDEEMHGKAVALFDFAHENENELPLVEGQVIWVSYRHGQGWLVAEDPKTRESGLVPEKYVRLLRDIEGGWTSLSDVVHDNNFPGMVLDEITADPSANMTPTAADPAFGHSRQQSNGNSASSDKRAPIVSTFSTSSNDLNPYPHPLLGT